MPTDKLMTHQRFEKMVGPVQANGCRHWLGVKKESGRGIFVESTQPRRCTSAPRYAYRFYVGPIPVGQYVMPKCGSNDCLAPSHLTLVKRSQIAQDAIKQGTWPQIANFKNNPPNRFPGSLNGNSRYSDETIKSIRQDRARGDKIQVIALRRHIPVSSVSFICTRRIG
jgi:hypothetical protein